MKTNGSVSADNQFPQKDDNCLPDFYRFFHSRSSHTLSKYQSFRLIEHPVCLRMNDGLTEVAPL
jgi:hypothetical protein